MPVSQKILQQVLSKNLWLLWLVENLNLHELIMSPYFINLAKFDNICWMIISIIVFFLSVSKCSSLTCVIRVCMMYLRLSQFFIFSVCNDILPDCLVYATSRKQCQSLPFFSKYCRRTCNFCGK